MDERIKKFWNGKTTITTKAEGLLRKIQTQKFLCLSLLDLLSALRKLPLIFQMDSLFVCSFPCYLGECLSTMEELHMVLSENFRKHFTEAVYQKSGIGFFSRNHVNFASANRWRSDSCTTKFRWFLWSLWKYWMIQLTILRIILDCEY